MATTNETVLSLQDQFAPNQICFGCGPANLQGLRVKSFVQGDRVVATFDPQGHHQGFQGMISGGIIGTLFDCHMNWTAAWHLMQASGGDEPPCTVTGQFQVKFQAPTPAGYLLHLESRLIESGRRKAEVAVTLTANDQLTATGQGVFIAVKEGHPAFNKWS